MLSLWRRLLCRLGWHGYDIVNEGLMVVWTCRRCRCSLRMPLSEAVYRGLTDGSIPYGRVIPPQGDSGTAPPAASLPRPRPSGDRVH